MKNKLFKAILISMLVIGSLGACSVLPTDTSAGSTQTAH